MVSTIEGFHCTALKLVPTAVGANLRVACYKVIPLNRIHPLLCVLSHAVEKFK